MKIKQKKYSETKGWITLRDDLSASSSCNLVLVFSSTAKLEDPSLFDSIKKEYPAAQIILSSTAGEIAGIEVSDDSIVLTAIWFEKTKIIARSLQIADMKNSFEAGKKLASELAPDDLKYVLIISDGQKVNGSELVLGLQQRLPKDTILTGGLAGDGARFQKTLVGLNESAIEGLIVAVGFYGDSLTVTYGSMGGWDSFGPERLITKSESNILYELDRKPALDIYKMYLGDYASELPGSGLLFPLSIRGDENTSLVRTILAVNENDKSLTFAGNMPEGSYARLMKASLDRLIEGASDAAQNSMDNKSSSPELALLISCVGRKLVLDQRIEEEVEEVRRIYGNKTTIFGFYSYGEISPTFNFAKCELHNQTMTITTLTEK